MALIAINNPMLSDLVVHEVDTSAGYAHRMVVLNDDETVFDMGTLVTRTISSGQLDQAAAYSKVDLGSDTDLVATNEFAVVFGDAYSARDEFTTGKAADAPHKGVAFVRGEVQLKAGKIQAVNGASDAQMVKIKALLEAQGIILLDTQE